MTRSLLITLALLVSSAHAEKDPIYRLGSSLDVRPIVELKTGVLHTELPDNEAIFAGFKEALRSLLSLDVAPMGKPTYDLVLTITQTRSREFRVKEFEGELSLRYDSGRTISKSLPVIVYSTPGTHPTGYIHFENRPNDLRVQDLPSFETSGILRARGEQIVAALEPKFTCGERVDRPKPFAALRSLFGY